MMGNWIKLNAVARGLRADQTQVTLRPGDMAHVGPFDDPDKYRSGYFAYIGKGDAMALIAAGKAFELNGHNERVTLVPPKVSPSDGQELNTTYNMIGKSLDETHQAIIWGLLQNGYDLAAKIQPDILLEDLVDHIDGMPVLSIPTYDTESLWVKRNQRSEALLARWQAYGGDTVGFMRALWEVPALILALPPDFGERK